MAKIRNDEYQISVAKKIVDLFDSGVQNVVLEAPTGSGKTGIAWFVHQLSKYTTTVLSHQKVLQDQYESLLGSDNYIDFLTLKGKANYECILNKKWTVESAPCSYFKYKCKFKNNCTYWRLRMEAEKTNFLNMNYQQIFLIYDNSIDTFKYNKDLYIYDECHNFKNIYTDIRSISIKSQESDFFNLIKRLSDDDGFNSLCEILEDSMAYYKDIDYNKLQNNIEYGLNTFKHVSNIKYQLVNELNETVKKHEIDLLERGRIHLYSQCITNIDMWLGKYWKLMGFKSHIIDNNNFVIESTFGEKTTECKIIPLDISNIYSSEANDFSNSRLFMSSTIFGGERFISELGLEDQKNEYIYLDSRFALDNRPIFSIPIRSINETLVNSDEITKYFDDILNVVFDHASKGHSGIIFSPSYKLTKLFAEYSYKLLENNDIDLLYNLDVDSRDDILNRFIERNNRIKVLVSPSFYEGVNLEGDISRYQIIMKVPFKYLGSKYVKTCMNKYPTWYSLEALKLIVQAAGRSVRNKDDYAATYIFDSNWINVYNRCKQFIPKWFDEAIQWIK